MTSLLDILNGAPMAEDDHYGSMFFDCLPPGRYDTEGRRLGDATSYLEHVRGMSAFMVELADYAFTLNKASIGRIEVGSTFAELMRAQERWIASKGDMRNGAGSWRGYPVYINSQIPPDRGAMVSRAGKVIGVMTVGTLAAHKERKKQLGDAINGK